MSNLDPRRPAGRPERRAIQTYGALLIGTGLGLAAGRTPPALVCSLIALALGVTALVWAHRMEKR